MPIHTDDISQAGFHAKPLLTKAAIKPKLHFRIITVAPQVLVGMGASQPRFRFPNILSIP